MRSLFKLLCPVPPRLHSPPTRDHSLQCLQGPTDLVPRKHKECTLNNGHTCCRVALPRGPPWKIFYEMDRSRVGRPCHANRQIDRILSWSVWGFCWRSETCSQLRARSPLPHRFGIQPTHKSNLQFCWWWLLEGQNTRQNWITQCWSRLQKWRPDLDY